MVSGDVRVWCFRSSKGVMGVQIEESKVSAMPKPFKTRLCD